MPNDDDLDDRPRRRRRDDFDDDEDDDLDRPRRRRRKPASSGYSTGLIIGLALALGCCVLGVPIGIGLLLPAVQKVREAASKTQNANNMKVVGLAAFNEDAVEGRGFYAPYAHNSRTGELYRGNSFRVSLLPYMEQQALYSQFDLSQPWDSARNRSASGTVIKTLLPPGDPEVPETPYRAFVGGGALFNADGTPVRIADIRDGTSNTLMMAHATDRVPWAKPQDLTYNPTGALPAVGDKGANGFNAMFADGSVRFLRLPAPDKAFRAMITRAGGEAVGPDW
jgi:prepilin-type processing-associated H-X9-DG protein